MTHGIFLMLDFAVTEHWPFMLVHIYLPANEADRAG